MWPSHCRVFVCNVTQSLWGVLVQCDLVMKRCVCVMWPRSVRCLCAVTQSIRCLCAMLPSFCVSVQSDPVIVRGLCAMWPSHLCLWAMWPIHWDVCAMWPTHVRCVIAMWPSHLGVCLQCHPVTVVFVSSVTQLCEVFVCDGTQSV